MVTYYPFPMYEEEVNGGTVTKRSTYLLGSQAVAVRTQVNSGTATFYYLLGDHLGSASTIVQTNGTVAYQGRFLPFGGERAFPGFSSSNNPTELGFTGHHQNMELGLVYMNARFYVPGVGRFASADTVVPNPAMPQSFNRYSYVVNNPIGFNDPTGHIFESPWDAFSFGVGVVSLGYNLYEGNYTDAAIDVGGLIVDGIATLTPGMPGGASMLIKAARTANAVDNALDVGSAAVKYGDEAVQLADEAVEIASEAGDELIDVYRGTDNYAEKAIHSDTGYLMSDTARKAFIETGGNLDEAFVASQNRHNELLNVFSSEQALVEAQSQLGTEFTQQYGSRSLFSVTTDPNTANIFAGQNGVIYHGQVWRSQLIKQTLGTSGESEYFIRHMSNVFKIWSD